MDFSFFPFFPHLAASGLRRHTQEVPCVMQNILLQHMDSPVVAHRLSSCVTWALKRGGFSSCGTQAYLFRGMWDLSSPTSDQTNVPCIASWILNRWITWEILWTSSHRLQIISFLKYLMQFKCYVNTCHCGEIQVLVLGTHWNFSPWIFSIWDWLNLRLWNPCI